MLLSNMLLRSLYSFYLQMGAKLSWWISLKYRFRQVTAHCNVACGSGIVTVNSPSGSTLQSDTWLWNDMPLNSPKRPPYWNSTSGLHFHTSPQSTCHSVPVCEILSKSDHLRQKKMTPCRFSRWRISAILDFRGTIIDTIALNCLVFFWENGVFCILATDRRTNRWTAPMH